MCDAIDRLLERSSPATGAAERAWAPPDATGRLGEELAELLRRRDGFLAFASALRVFPASPSGAQRSLDEWNAPGLWRDAYDGLADGLVCFAEDAFGGQFALAGDEVVAFDPETGDRRRAAASIEGWADAILRDHEVRTGWPLAVAWQERHGALPHHARLVPTIPFVLGGAYDVANLHLLDAVEGMRLRGEIAVQLRDTADGSRVRLRMVDDG
jgi:hypothetical protein